MLVLLQNLLYFGSKESFCEGITLHEILLTQSIYFSLDGIFMRLEFLMYIVEMTGNIKISEMDYFYGNLL